MKKSDYLKQREEFWGSKGWRSGERLGRVEWDVQAAEAAGVAWDPEEKPLPEKLQVSPYAPLDTNYIESDGVYWLCISNPRVNTHMGLTTAEQRLALAREVVRRYNLFPELERLAEQLETDTHPEECSIRGAGHALRKVLAKK